MFRVRNWGKSCGCTCETHATSDGTCFLRNMKKDHLYKYVPKGLIHLYCIFIFKLEIFKNFPTNNFYGNLSSGILSAQFRFCQIPWKVTADGPELYTCTSYRSPSGETDERLGNQWCATSVNYDLTYKDWDWCSGINVFHYCFLSSQNFK